MQWERISKGTGSVSDRPGARDANPTSIGMRQMTNSVGAIGWAFNGTNR